MARISNKIEHGFDSNDDAPAPRYGMATYTTPSSALPAPIDDNGMPMLSNKEVGPILGYSPGNEKKAGYEHIIRQHKVYKDEDMAENSRATGQGARTWFSQEDVVNHLGTCETCKAKDPNGAKFKFHSKMLLSAKAAIAKQRKAGGPVHTWENQPHPGNKNIHKRTYIGDRVYTEDPDELGFTFPSGETRPQATVPTSNLDNPIKHERMRRPGDIQK